jgi:hypothetical protein
VYTLDESTKQCIAFNVARATESLGAAGAPVIDTAPMNGNSHQLGTARMGDDPATSVVDRWGMTHDVANLGIVDGSVFVTAGAVNPTSTICALALRAVDHLIERRADVDPPSRARSFAIPAAPTVVPPSEQPVPLTTRPRLTPDERQRLDALADVLVPGDARMPSASDAGIAGDLVDWVLDVRPDLAVPLRRALAEPVDDPAFDGRLRSGDPGSALASAASPAARLDALRRTERAVYYDLVLSVVAGYYHTPIVRDLIGYPGREAHPVTGLDFPEYVSEGLLDFMLESAPSDIR